MKFKTSALIATLALTASATYASSDENNLLEDYLNAKAHVAALSYQANNDYNTPAQLSQKLDAYEEKVDELQQQFDIQHSTATTAAN